MLHHVPMFFFCWLQRTSKTPADRRYDLDDDEYAYEYDDENNNRDYNTTGTNEKEESCRLRGAAPRRREDDLISSYQRDQAAWLEFMQTTTVQFQDLKKTRQRKACLLAYDENNNDKNSGGSSNEQQQQQRDDDETAADQCRDDNNATAASQLDRGGGQEEDDCCWCDLLTDERDCDEQGENISSCEMTASSTSSSFSSSWMISAGLLRTVPFISLDLNLEPTDYSTSSAYEVEGGDDEDNAPRKEVTEKSSDQNESSASASIGMCELYRDRQEVLLRQQEQAQQLLIQSQSVMGGPGPDHEPMPVEKLLPWIPVSSSLRQQTSSLLLGAAPVHKDPGTVSGKDQSSAPGSRASATTQERTGRNGGEEEPAYPISPANDDTEKARGSIPYQICIPSLENHPEKDALISSFPASSCPSLTSSSFASITTTTVRDDRKCGEECNCCIQADQLALEGDAGDYAVQIAAGELEHRMLMILDPVDAPLVHGAIDCENEYLQSVSHKFYALLLEHELHRNSFDGLVKLMHEHPVVCQVQYPHLLSQSRDAEGPRIPSSAEASSGTVKGCRYCYPLAYFSATGCLQGVEAAYKAFPEAIGHEDEWLGTPMHYAVAFVADLGIVQFLHERYPEAVKKCSNDKQQTPLHLVAASAGHTNNSLPVAKLLLGYYPTAAQLADLDGYTPLHLACRCVGQVQKKSLENEEDHLEFLRLLLKQSPNVIRARTADWRTALHIAAATAASGQNRMEHHLRVLELLYQHDSTAAMSTDENFDTPLHAALQGGSASCELLSCLIPMYRAALSWTNQDGLTPYQIAAHRKTSHEGNILAMLQPPDNDRDKEQL